MAAAMDAPKAERIQMPEFDRMSELRAFDGTKAGVKGLVDANVTEIPRIFHLPPDYTSEKDSAPTAKGITVPTIDLGAITESSAMRQRVVEEVKHAGETWGFFQVVNHGMSVSVMEKIKEGVRRFHEQDVEVKRSFYSRDITKKVGWNCNFDLYTAPATNWRDTLFGLIAPDPPKIEDMPEACRDIMIEYSKLVLNLGCLLFELLSEALGLKPNHLAAMECTNGLLMLGHYYPPCPQPELTLGTSKHADNNFLTILLQDHIGGLQILHENHWVDVHPTPGALVVNFGEMLQLITNDRFKSVMHRVLANRCPEPRVSVACFFTRRFNPNPKVYGPIKELLSDENPPKYKEVLEAEYFEVYQRTGLDGTSKLEHFRI